MLQVALSRRSQQISGATALDVDRSCVFNIPDAVAATASTYAPTPRCASAGTVKPEPLAAEPTAALQIADDKAAVRTPRREIGMSPRYLPAVVAAGKNIIADAKDLPAPPPTRDRKKRELRPKDTVASLLSDASETISGLVDEQDKDDNPECPDSPLSLLVRRSSKQRAQTVRVNQGAISSVFSPRGSIGPARQVSDAQSQEPPLATGPEYSAAAVEEAITGPVVTDAQIIASNTSEQRVLSDTEVQEKNRRTLDWFRNSESVNRASQISLDFATRLSVLRHRRRGGGTGSGDSEVAGHAAAESGYEDTRAASKRSAPPEAYASGRSRSTESPAYAADNAPPDQAAGNVAATGNTVKRGSREVGRGLHSARTIQ